MMLAPAACPDAANARGETARFVGGVEEPLAAVIWATGCHDDATWVHIPGVADRRGTFTETNGESKVGGLFFVGRAWQLTQGSALLLGVGTDAAAIAERFRRFIAAPQSDER